MTSQQELHGTPLPKISAPATRALATIGVTIVEQLAEHTEQELLALHGFGPKAIRILTPVMEDLGLGFKAESYTESG